MGRVVRGKRGQNRWGPLRFLGRTEKEKIVGHGMNQLLKVNGRCCIGEKQNVDLFSERESTGAIGGREIYGPIGGSNCYGHQSDEYNIIRSNYRIRDKTDTDGDKLWKSISNLGVVMEDPNNVYNTFLIEMEKNDRMRKEGRKVQPNICQW